MFNKIQRTNPKLKAQNSQQDRPKKTRLIIDYHNFDIGLKRLYEAGQPSFSESTDSIQRHKLFIGLIYHFADFECCLVTGEHNQLPTPSLYFKYKAYREQL